VPLDPKTVHATDQLIAYFGTLGRAFFAFAREAMDAGASREEAVVAATHTVAAFVAKPLEAPDA